MSPRQPAFGTVIEIRQQKAASDFFRRKEWATENGIEFISTSIMQPLYCDYRPGALKTLGRSRCWGWEVQRVLDNTRYTRQVLGIATFVSQCPSVSIHLILVLSSYSFLLLNKYLIRPYFWCQLCVNVFNHDDLSSRGHTYDQLGSDICLLLLQSAL